MGSLEYAWFMWKKYKRVADGALCVGAVLAIAAVQFNMAVLFVPILACFYVCRVSRDDQLRYVSLINNDPKLDAEYW